MSVVGALLGAARVLMARGEVGSRPGRRGDVVRRVVEAESHDGVEHSLM